jgi:hypothetical protein
MEIQTIRARVGKPVEVRREAAGSGGGYVWRARLLNESGATVIEVESTEADTAGGKIPRSPLDQTFVIESTKSG